jgi:hypothetical protein
MSLAEDDAVYTAVVRVVKKMAVFSSSDKGRLWNYFLAFSV